jgi:hypothetical protein
MQPGGSILVGRRQFGRAKHAGWMSAACSPLRTQFCGSGELDSLEAIIQWVGAPLAPSALLFCKLQGAVRKRAGIAS